MVFCIGDRFIQRSDKYSDQTKGEDIEGMDCMCGVVFISSPNIFIGSELMFFVVIFLVLNLFCLFFCYHPSNQNTITDIYFIFSYIIIRLSPNNRG